MGEEDTIILTPDEKDKILQDVPLEDAEEEDEDENS